MEYRFKEIREDNDLKQHDVATKINISRGGYANIEAETANIKLKYFLSFCNEMNCTMDYVANLTHNNKTHLITHIDKIDKSIMTERLNTLETENNKEAQDIAKELGISKSTYSHYKNVNNDRLMQTLMLKRLAEKYGYSMDWLVGRSNKKFR